VQTPAAEEEADTVSAAADWTVIAAVDPAEPTASFALTVPVHEILPVEAAVAVQVNTTVAPGPSVATDVVAAVPAHDAAAEPLQIPAFTPVAVPAPVLVTVIVTRKDWPTETMAGPADSRAWSTTDGPSVNEGPAVDAWTGAQAIAADAYTVLPTVVAAVTVPTVPETVKV